MNVQRLKPTDNELRNQRVIQGHSAGYGAILLLLRRLHLFLGRRFLAHDRRSGRLFSRLDLSGPVRDRSDDHPADHRNLLDFRQILPADHGLRGRNLHVRLRYGDLFGHGARRVLRGGTCRLGTRADNRLRRDRSHRIDPFQADYREQRRSDARRQSRRLLPATGVNFRDRGRVLCGRSMGMDFHPAGRRDDGSFRCRQRHGRHSLHLHFADRSGREHRAPRAQRVLRSGKKPVAQTGARHGLDRSDLGPDRRFRRSGA